MGTTHHHQEHVYRGSPLLSLRVGCEDPGGVGSYLSLKMSGTPATKKGGNSGRRNIRSKVKEVRNEGIFRH